MKPTIESGIPLPDRGRDGSTQKELRTALRNMKHGDSFVWPDNDFPYRAAKPRHPGRLDATGEAEFESEREKETEGNCW